VKRTAQMVEESISLKAPKNRGGRPKGSEDKKPRTVNANSLAAIKPFQWPKGFSANPGGMPGTDVAAIIVRRVLENNAERAYEGLTKAARDGNAYAF
jgi:hypothetical protein